jgi:hypothetical protein
MDELELQTAIRAAIAIADGNALHALAKAHPSLAPCTLHAYPWVHRIMDIQRPGRGSVRVLRCTPCGGKLALVRQPGRAALEMGVPLELPLAGQTKLAKAKLAEWERAKKKR